LQFVACQSARQQSRPGAYREERGYAFYRENRYAGIRIHVNIAVAVYIQVTAER
jgi:hypothetical protein